MADASTGTTGRSAADLLRRLAASNTVTDLRVLMVVAHPDDETIGLGAQLPRIKDLSLLHVTDGAPRDGADMRAQGFRSPEDYARARRRELHAALRLAGVDTARAQELAVPDQEAAPGMAWLACGIAEFFRNAKPDVVVTHPYEGGHPDHDATAFAVHAACHLLRAEGVQPPDLGEMASYHMGPTGIEVGRFLPAEGTVPVILALSPEGYELKRRMLDCFVTQRQTLTYFPIGAESLRLAPVYDFRRAPHAGTLFYEKFSWGMTGRHFREIASRALEELGLGGSI